MKSIPLLLLFFFFTSCSEKQAPEVNDGYALIEFASKLEEADATENPEKTKTP